MMTIEFDADAEREMTEAYFWYENQREGLGDRFFLSIEALLSRIQRNPQSYSIIFENSRSAILTKFPCKLIYEIEEKIIYIQAVFHTKRNPQSLTIRFH